MSFLSGNGLLFANEEYFYICGMYGLCVYLGCLDSGVVLILAESILHVCMPQIYRDSKIPQMRLWQFEIQICVTFLGDGVNLPQGRAKHVMNDRRTFFAGATKFE